MTQEEQKSDGCTWNQNNDGCHLTACGYAFEFVTGTPTQNNVLFCPFCGKRITHPFNEQCCDCGGCGCDDCDWDGTEATRQRLRSEQRAGIMPRDTTIERNTKQ